MTALDTDVIMVVAMAMADVGGWPLSNSTQQPTARAITQPQDQTHRARLAAGRPKRWADPVP